METNLSHQEHGQNKWIRIGKPSTAPNNISKAETRDSEYGVLAAIVEAEDGYAGLAIEYRQEEQH